MKRDVYSSRFKQNSRALKSSRGIRRSAEKKARFLLQHVSQSQAPLFSAMESLTDLSIHFATSLNIPCPVPVDGHPLTLSVLIHLLIRAVATLLWRKKFQLGGFLMLSFMLCRLFIFTESSFQYASELYGLILIARYTSLGNTLKFVLTYLFLKTVTAPSSLPMAIVVSATIVIFVIFQYLISSILAFLLFLKNIFTHPFRRG